MGFKDSEFEKVEGKFSQKDLYTFAGNSIVVDVAEEIFCQIFDSDGEIWL